VSTSSANGAGGLPSGVARLVRGVACRACPKRTSRSSLIDVRLSEPWSVAGTFETSTDVRSTGAFGGKADMSPSRPDPDRSRQWHASHQRTHPFVRDHDGSADHVGGVLLTSGASKASFPPLCKDHGDLRSLSGSSSAMNDLFNRVRGAVGQRHGLTDARNGQKVAGLFGID
jgi:hypothetical protein